LLQSKGLSRPTFHDVSPNKTWLCHQDRENREFEYDVGQNASPRTVAELNDLPIKQVDSSTIYLRDVAR